MKVRSVVVMQKSTDPCEAAAPARAEAQTEAEAAPSAQAAARAETQVPAASPGQAAARAETQVPAASPGQAAARAETQVPAASPAQAAPPAEAAHYSYRLLGADEPPPFVELGRQGRSNFVIVVDHASHRIPRRLGNLGLPEIELQRHIAWDIGALAVAGRVAAALDAPLVAQNYSRLVIDCNRDPKVATSIPTLGESIEIPGNLSLNADEIAARRAEIFDPYHDHVRALLDERLAAGRPTILVAQHSMTNVFKGVPREMHAAVLYNRDRRFAGLVLDRLRRDADFLIGDNEPYFVSDETDYTIPRHGEARALPHVEIEIRQDLISDDAGQDEWAQRICRALQDAEHTFLGTHAAIGTP
jgi:predicted N-formylglutamate amidohydrolase